MNLATWMLFLLAVSSSHSSRNRQPQKTTTNRKHQRRRHIFSLTDAGSCNVDVVCFIPCDDIVYQIINEVCGSRKGCKCHVLVFGSVWSERCNCGYDSFLSSRTPSTTVLTTAADMLGATVTSRTCEITGIVCAVVAFLLGVIVSLAVVLIRQKRSNRQHEESSGKNGVSETCAQVEEVSDHREGSNAYYLRKEPDKSNDVSSVIDSETSPDVLPNEEVSDGGVYCHLAVVSEAETRDNISLTPLDNEKSFTAPLADSRQVDASQQLPSHDKHVDSSIIETFRVSQARSVTVTPLQPRFDDADEYSRLGCHGDRDNAASSALAADDTYQHVTCPRFTDEKPVSSNYELAHAITDGDKAKENKSARIFADELQSTPDSCRTSSV